MHTHGSMAAASATINMTSDLRYGDRYLQMLPLFHVGALTPVTAGFHRGASARHDARLRPRARLPA